MKRLTKRIKSTLGPEIVCYIGDHAQHDEDIAAELTSAAVREVLDRLAEFEDAEEAVDRAKVDGRLVVLPCKIGTAVYRLDFNQHDGAWLEPHFFQLQDLEHVGTTIFLTLEEAEAEIRRLEHG